MEKKEFEILLKKLINSDKFSLSVSELKELKNLFSNEDNNKTINDWLFQIWTDSDYEDIKFNYENLKEKIREAERGKKAQTGTLRLLKTFSKHYQKVAAILFLPILLIGGLIYFWSSSSQQDAFYITEAPLGQKAKIELSDGTVVWLNSGTTIKYPTNYNKKSRNISLNGEAFFEVKKDPQRPFLVHTSSIEIEVTGTRFNVNAYSDEPIIETALVEGHVNLIVKGKNEKHELTPGNLFEYKKATGKLSKRKFTEDVTTGWKENRLIFVNDNFAKLARKIERWYDMKVVYDSLDFADNKLTVRLIEGERLSKLLEIIEATSGAQCTVEGNKILITKKNAYAK
jgi:ferric-dicitrate binding protein FerR (iron transport regulator)